MSKIVFLLKTMNSKYLSDTVEKGRLCFCHPNVFSGWEDRKAAQYDRWEGHSAFEANYIVVAPIVSEKPGRIVYGEGKVLADEGIVRLQTDNAKKTPICCFRAVDDSELTRIAGETVYSLGNTVDRIKQEFHHDAFVLTRFDPFIDRVRKVNCFRLAGNVIYQDLLNDYPYEIDETNREIMEQLFRKDEKYAWQKEFRIILRPDENEKKLVDISSLSDISVYGRIDELKQGIQIHDMDPESLC